MKKKGEQEREKGDHFFGIFKMGSLWRSEDMRLIQMIMQKESAHDIVDELGRTGIVEFRDVRRNRVFCAVVRGTRRVVLMVSCSFLRS